MSRAVSGLVGDLKRPWMWVAIWGSTCQRRAGGTQRCNHYVVNVLPVR